MSRFLSLDRALLMLLLAIGGAKPARGQRLRLRYALELLQLQDIGARVALDKVGDIIDARRAGREPLKVDASVVANAGCRSRAHHLGRALVAVTRRAAVVDDAEGAAGETQHDHRIVDVAGRREGRV